MRDCGVVSISCALFVACFVWAGLCMFYFWSWWDYGSCCVVRGVFVVVFWCVWCWLRVMVVRCWVHVCGVLVVGLCLSCRRHCCCVGVVR